MKTTVKMNFGWNVRLRIVCIVLFLGLMGAGLLLPSYNLIYFGILSLFIHNVLFAFERIKTRIYFFILHFTFFVFYMTVPLIKFFRGEAWWNYRSGPDFALSAMTISLLFMMVGAYLAEKLAQRRSSWFQGSKRPRKCLQRNFMKSFRMRRSWYSAFPGPFISVCSLKSFFFSGGRIIWTIILSFRAGRRGL